MPANRLKRRIQGDRNNGFDILYHNMKDGLTASRELQDYLRESCTVEESYIKLQTKLAKFSSTCNSRGSFGPFWQMLKLLAEKLASIHQQLLISWQDMMKDIHKYSTEQQRKHREVKEQEGGTAEMVQSLQLALVAVQKAKENYHSRCFEFEKLKRDTASPRDIERAETKLKKTNEDYRLALDKYNNLKNEFESNVTSSCKRFQEVEEVHLQQMKDYVEAYTKTWHNHLSALNQMLEEFRAGCGKLTVEKLLEIFFQSKSSSGIEKPGILEFVEPDLSSLPLNGSLVDGERRVTPSPSQKKDTGGDYHSQKSSDYHSQKSSDSSSHKSNFSSSHDAPHNSHHDSHLHHLAWILNIRPKKKTKDARNKKKSSADNGKDLHLVDEEGFSIRPENAENYNNGDRDNWYNSSSDTDSDGDDVRPNKLKIEIKPISPQSGRASAADSKIMPINETSVHLTPPPSNGPGNRLSSKPSEDLIGLDLVFDSPPTTFVSSAFPVVANGNLQANHFSTAPSGSSLSGLNGDSARVQALVNHQPLIPSPIPPPGRTITPRLTPELFRTNQRDSSSSPSFFNTNCFVSSSGPSPISSGTPDSIPLAVSFSETVHALFKGADQSKCQCKVNGDMVMSFPTGILRILQNAGPSPNVLSFRIKNFSILDQIVLNKQLVSEDADQSSPDGHVYRFEMQSLIDHLQKQMEMNKSASYFNIDILKYQVKYPPGFTRVPLQLVSYWKCEESRTCFRLDYNYNAQAFSTPQPLTNMSIILPVDGGVRKMESVDPGTWSSELNRATWKIPDLVESSENKSLLAQFELNSGPSVPSACAVQFVCEGTTITGVDFELLGPGFRISLVKKRFLTGRYLSDCGV